MQARKSVSLKRNPLVLVLMLAYLMLSAIFNVTIGVGETPDEPPHMAYVRYVVERRALPIQTRDPAGRISNEAHQPPAYYVLGALLTGWIDSGDFQLVSNPAFDIVPGRVWARQRFYHTKAEAFPYRGLALAYHWLRGFSAVLGALTIWAVHQAARLIAPQRPIVALLAAGLVAFNPQFLFMTASVNNDNLAMAVASLTLLVGLMAWRRPSLRLTVAMGLLIGLAALTKYTALAVAPGALLALAAPYLRERRWRALAGQIALIAVIAALMSGWWYIRNWQLYGDPLAERIASHVLAPVRRYSPWTLDELPSNVVTAFVSSWGVFGWMNIQLHPAIYVALALLCLAALAGLFLIARRVTRERRWRRWESIPYLALALAGAMMVALAARYHLFVPADQGRLFFSGVVAFSILLSLGLVELAGRWHAWMARGVMAGLALLSIGCLIFVLGPAFARPPMLSEADLRGVSRPMKARYGEGIALRGFDVSPRALRPSQSFEVTLYWQALRPIDTNYWLLIQALDPSGRPLAHSTTLPYLGRYATVLWQPGDMFADRYGLTIVPDALPGAAELVVLLDSKGASPDDTEWTLDGQPVGDRLRLTTLKIAPQSQPVYRPTHSLSVRLGDAARLMGYDLSASSVRAGQTVTVTLYWQVLRPTQQDVRVFLHLLCPGEQLIAQDDSVPGLGWYPSAIWAAGDVIRDEHVLEIGDAPAGACALSTGLYDFDTGHRLAAVDADNQRLTDDRVTLTNLDILP